MTTRPTETEWTLDHVLNALAEIKIDVADIAKSINGNGAPGIKGRLVRLETIVTLMVGLIVLSVSIASCAVSNGYLVVPQQKTSRAK